MAGVRRGLARRIVATTLIFFSVYVLLIPGLTATWFIVTDRGLRADEPSRFAIRYHKKSAPHYAKYARQRIASGDAASHSIFEIAATEWPLFGSAFFLWSTEQLQADYEETPELFTDEPKRYARGAVEAATDLVLDPNHAKWVRDHWKDEYLTRENCFYRMLIISATTAHFKLTEDPKHNAILRQQVDSLKKELLATSSGLIDDYPGQCYPGDVVAAVVAILRGDEALGTPDPAFARQIGEKIFRRGQVTRFGLPPYAANSRSGIPLDQSRGCGNSYFTTFAPLA